MYYILYKTTNIINNRFYIGIHSTDNLNDGYLGSGDRVRHEIRKYGNINFKREILEYVASVEDLYKREAEIVNEDLLANPLCLNLTLGGHGGKLSAESHQKRKETFARIGHQKGEKNNRRGRCEINDGIKTISVPKEKLEEYLNNGYKKGRHLTHRQMTNNEINIRVREDFIEEYLNDGYVIGNSNSRGEKNHQFGTCWVTNGIESFKIKKEKLEEYLNNGYEPGHSNKVVTNFKEGNIWVTNGTDSISITSDKLEEYLDNGYTYGRHTIGEKHPQFGTCWVNNGMESIQIKKENLDEYSTKGYDLGKCQSQEQINQYKEWYALYNEVGWKKFVELTGYDKSKDNFRHMWAKIKFQNNIEDIPKIKACWVTDGIKNIQIKETMLEEYLASGYVRGMIKRVQ